MPYPQLNELVQYRKRQDRSWYFYQAVMALMQAYGRGIRDMDDYCTMYIIDSSFKRLFDYNRKFFNQYFEEAVLAARKDLRAKAKKKPKGFKT
jgi:Rad3-related DNA helicase